MILVKWEKEFFESLESDIFIMIFVLGFGLVNFISYYVLEYVMILICYVLIVSG